MQFPDAAKAQWLEYIKTITADPYKDHEKLGAELSAQMIAILKETSETAKKDEGKFYATTLLQEIEAQKAGTGAHAIVIRNFPIDDISNINTPTTWGDFGTNGKAFISEYSHLALVNAIGMKPMTDPDISGGQPFQHITPRVGKENSVGNAGSKAEFHVHTEKSFIETPPAALSLLGLRNWTQTPTNVFFLEETLKYLTSKEIDTLHRDEFIFPAGEALNTDVQKQIEGPVVTENNGIKEFRIKLDTIMGKTPAATRVIEKLTKIFSDPEKYIGLHGSVVITPGAMLTFNNRTLGHGRPAIIGEKATNTLQQPNSKERWLQRVTAEKSTPVEGRT